MNAMDLQAPVRVDSDEARWNAVLTRDTAADGAFYFSVATTGVYCRPSCGARTRLRRNVAFHATPADAERSAGTFWRMLRRDAGARCLLRAMRRSPAFGTP